MDLTDLLPKNSADARRRQASLLPGRDEIGDDIHWGDTGAIDHVLQARTIEGSASISVRALTDAQRAKNALRLPVEAGTRVTFVANLGSVLSYEDIPGDKMAGTVVTVRCAGGDVTAYNDRVHVLWDDGKFRPVMAEHLMLAGTSEKRASAVRMRVSNFGDLSGFFAPVLDSFHKTAAGGQDLVHKATKDLWSFRQDNQGFVIERLFSEDGAPLKV